jgi:hypothetical protein
MYYRFLLSLAAALKRGEVLRSRYATAGFNTTAAEGLRGYSVHNDITGVVSYTPKPMAAVIEWHNINMRAMSEERRHTERK